MSREGLDGYAAPAINLRMPTVCQRMRTSVDSCGLLRTLFPIPMRVFGLLIGCQISLVMSRGKRFESARRLFTFYRFAGETQNETRNWARVPGPFTLTVH
jgi:hypothetical protein